MTELYSTWTKSLDMLNRIFEKWRGYIDKQTPTINALILYSERIFFTYNCNFSASDYDWNRQFLSLVFLLFDDAVKC